MSDVLFELINEDGTPKLPNSFDEDHSATRALDDSARDALVAQQREALGNARSVITSCRVDRFRVSPIEMHRVISSLAVPAKSKVINTNTNSNSKSSKK